MATDSVTDTATLPGLFKAGEPQLDPRRLMVRGGLRWLEKGAMKQLCDDLRQFALEVHQLGYSLNGGVGERQCLDLSERMLAAVKQAEGRMAGAKSTPPFVAQR